MGGSGSVSVPLLSVQQASQTKDNELEAAIAAVQDMQNKLIGGPGSEESSCDGTTFGSGGTLCLVRHELHGGVAGTCNTAGNNGWCSYRCNNGVWRGANGCNGACTCTNGTPETGIKVR